MIEPDARLVDQTGATYRPTPTVHMVSSDEIVLSTGTGFRCVHRDPIGRIPAEVAQELVLDGWLERIVREAAVESLVLADIVADHSTATLVMPESLARDPLIEAWASELRRRGLSVVLILQAADLSSDGADPQDDGGVAHYREPTQHWEAVSLPGLARAYRRR
ncbi:hypothetical protein [Brevibacterium otitidis]|uniref:Uncharacterized protein n=1 Tax=Brevibacterium otitidis TaxID=53364 RepID=A0ABV5X1R0_9MICO|nr:hypothetical protein GCM10023233_30390 [Brevibacterium otitidis]